MSSSPSVKPAGRLRQERLPAEWSRPTVVSPIPRGPVIITTPSDKPGRHAPHFPNAVHVFSLGPVQSVTVSWRRRQRYVEQAEATEELLDDGRPLEQRRK